MKPCVALLVFFSCPLVHAAAPAGTASCAAAESECYITWQWTGEPRAYQWVQVFDPAINQWRAIAETALGQAGRSFDPVPRGHLYRLQSCEDSSATTNCMETSLVWALLQPREDEIPPAIVDERGNVIGIPKNVPYESKLSTLNIVSMIMELEKAPWSEMPPMTRPERRWDSKDFRMSDNLTNNIFDGYEGARLAKPSRKEELKANPQVPMTPHWIGDVPPDQQREFRAKHLYGRSPDEAVIVFGPQTPKYTVTVFADVSCQHCKALMRDMSALNDLGIRLRFLAYPLTGPYSPDGRKMTNIWCSPDRKEAFKRALSDEPIEKIDCDTQTITYQYALAKRLGLVGSPAILTDDGEWIGGYLTPEQMIKRLQKR